MNMDEVKVEEGFKRCGRCGEVKPISDFNKCKRKSDGLQNYCKDCQKEMYAEWYAHNKEKIAEYQAEWRNLNKEKFAEYQAQYRQANKDAIAEYKAEWYNPQTHPLNWAKTIVNNYNNMDKERGFDTSQTITADWFLDNIAYRPCAHCGLQAIGLIGCNRLDNTKGHTIDNVEPCCFKCNLKENIRDQIARGLHWTCKHKKQSFSDFVNANKAKDKNSQ